jgi:hypothetical protein
MNYKWIGIVLLALLLLAACSNPIDKLEEAAAEQIAEQIVEQTTGIENIEIDEEGGSVSYSVEDGQGGQIDVAVDEATDMEAITGMGFTIAVPEGLVNGALQRVDNNGEETMVNATFEMGEVTVAELHQVLNESLTEQGFVYLDPTNSGRTAPDTNETALIVAYQHPEGYQFSIMGDGSGVVLGLVRMEEGAVTAVATTAAIPTTLDGSMTLDKTSYQAGEPIVVTLVINTPLADNGWIGVIPANIPHGLEVDGDNNYITYDWLYNLAGNQITLYAPDTPGSYDVRLYNTDDQGVEVAFVNFSVTE